MKSESSNSWLAVFPRIVLVIFISTILFGLLGTWLPAFGYLPVIGKSRFSFQPWIDLFTHPSLVKSLTATVVSGWGAPLLSVTLALSIVVFGYGGKSWRILERSLAPILSIPHAAFAIGFAFLVSPSGWLIRLVSPGLTGLASVPDWMTVKDPYGISLMVALVIKETPFLLLVIIGALNRLNIHDTLSVGRSLGYRSAQIWLKIVIPQLYPYIRLSVFAVIAYSLSVVDISLILGPTVPPTLPVLILRWFNDPDVQFRLLGAAGATLLLLIVFVSLGFAWISELVVFSVSRSWTSNGKRSSIWASFKPVNYAAISGILFFSLTAVIILFLWSFTWQWQYPDAFPAHWSTRFWSKGLTQAGWPILTTITTGITASIIALVLVIGCLEYEVVLRNAGRRLNYERLLWFAYLPLLVPQIAFIFGIQTLLAAIRLEGLWVTLVWSHLIFVYPYIFLTLSITYRNFDENISHLATILSGSRWKALMRVKLPMLLRPILFSFAIGFSVSVGQYIPTLFIGAGRFVTITTEAVNLASGSDRRIVAVYALCQQFLPLIVFAVAIFIPKMLFLNRRDMQI